MRWIASRKRRLVVARRRLTSQVVGRAGDLQHTTHRGQRQARSRFPLLLDQGDHLVFEDAARADVRLRSVQYFAVSVATEPVNRRDRQVA